MGVQDSRNKAKFSLNCNGKLLFIEKSIVMGIVNITQDSFFSSSRKLSLDEIVSTVIKMLDDGATIIDIGGQTSKPSSVADGVEAEMGRVIPVMKELCKLFPKVIFSIDTYNSEVAIAAVEAGASLVNDISGGQLDENMIASVGKLGVPYICTHIKGNPATMQLNPTYDNVVKEVFDYFVRKIEECQQAGIKDIIIDLGFGFGKSLIHNYELLQALEYFNVFNKPLLVGVSRKGMIHKYLAITPEEALNGTTALHTLALERGATMLRVHDVKEAVEVVKLVNKTHS